MLYIEALNNFFFNFELGRIALMVYVLISVTPTIILMGVVGVVPAFLKLVIATYVHRVSRRRTYKGKHKVTYVRSNRPTLSERAQLLFAVSTCFFACWTRKSIPIAIAER